jgi:AraC-like DNA-binding protein
LAHHKKGSEAGVAKVRAVIAGLALAGTISLESAARQLDTSPRTLQRRLRQRGISFWILVEQSRFEIAGALLRETDLKVQEIAASIGYATPSAFARAFTRWAGRSPTEYRNARAGRDH